MALLTSRTLASGVTASDLFHIVITSDVSQNPAGSSYKANMSQLQDFILTYNCSAITTSTATIQTGIQYYGVDYSGDVDLTLYSPVGNDGTFLTIKDEGGNARSNRIRIDASPSTIDGNSYLDMNINYMSLTLIARNNQWWII